jgi:hypothetical protein
MSELFQFPSVRAMATSIARTDYVRRSMWGLGARAGHREWFHFCVSEPGLELLLNFNVADDTRDPKQLGRQSGRLVVLLHTDSGWKGDVLDIDSEQIRLGGGRIFVQLGQNRLEFVDGVFRVSACLPGRSLELQLELEPASFPSLANNVALSASESPINWLVVPRLKASGRIVVDGRERVLQDAWAYHDHNWGHFSHRDFAWQWGHALPDDPANPFSVVFTRLGNRAQTDVFMQALLLWRGPRQHRVLREAELVVEAAGYCSVDAYTVPRVASLLTPGRTTDVPRRLLIRASGGDDEVKAIFDTKEVARIVVPHEHDLGTTTINEALGRLTMEGTIRGENFAFEGHGVFEFLGSGA